MFVRITWAPIGKFRGAVLGPCVEQMLPADAVWMILSHPCQWFTNLPQALCDRMQASGRQLQPSPAPSAGDPPAPPLAFNAGAFGGGGGFGAIGAKLAPRAQSSDGTFSGSAPSSFNAAPGRNL